MYTSKNMEYVRNMILTVSWSFLSSLSSQSHYHKIRKLWHEMKCRRKFDHNEMLKMFVFFCFRSRVIVEPDMRLSNLKCHEMSHCHGWSILSTIVVPNLEVMSLKFVESKNVWIPFPYPPRSYNWTFENYIEMMTICFVNESIFDKGQLLLR